MRICILKESLTIGGNERSAANSTKALAADHDVILALYDGAQTEYSYEGRLVDFKLPPRSSFLGKVWNTLCRDIKLRRLIKNERIDVLYTFTTIGNRQTRYRYDTVKIISGRDFGKMSVAHATYKKALDNSDAMICNSEYTKNYYLEKYPEDADKVYAVYNYIDTESIDRQSKENAEPTYTEFIRNHSCTAVSVGRFCREKGFEYLIEAFAKARKTNRGLGLVLVGDGEYKQKYIEAIERLDIREHVYFTGFQSNPYKYMAKCDLFVLSSLSEGFPNVLAEAMSLGLPVISVNCRSGPAEIVRADQDYTAVTDRYLECDYGILSCEMEKDDNAVAVGQLSEAICFLCENEEKRRHYASVSRQRAKDFSGEAMAKRLNAIFQELTDRRSCK